MNTRIVKILQGDLEQAKQKFHYLTVEIEGYTAPDGSNRYQATISTQYYLVRKWMEDHAGKELSWEDLEEFRKLVGEDYHREEQENDCEKR